MDHGLRQLIASSAPEPSRSLDMDNVLRRGQRLLWQRRVAGVFAVALSAVVLTAIVTMPARLSPSRDRPTNSAVGGSTPRDYIIERRGNTLYISGRDAAADPEAVANALQAAGVDADVNAVPSYPNLVGRWYELDFDPGLVTDRRLEHGLYDQVAHHVKVLKLPVDFPAPITLKVGRETKPDDMYSDGTGVNELLRRGALRCLHLDELTPPRAAEVLGRYGYDIIWAYDEQEHSEPPASGKIFWAWFRGPNLLQINVSLDGSEKMARSFDPPSGIQGPCSG